MTGTQPAGAIPRTDLERLLETERRLGERLTAARTAAEAVIAEAEAQASTREAALDSELQGEERRLSDALAQEQGQREREIAAAADQQVATMAAIPPEVVTVLARELAVRFLTGEEAR